MKQSPRLSHSASQTTKLPQTTRSAAMLLAATALDTTWRVFVPTLGGTFLGIWLDTTFHTVPIITIVTILLGMIISGLLIAEQLRRVRRGL